MRQTGQFSIQAGGRTSGNHLSAILSSSRGQKKEKKKKNVWRGWSKSWALKRSIPPEQKGRVNATSGISISSIREE